MRVLSGVQASGKLHLGNYLGAMAQHIELQNDNDCFFFIANYHSLTTMLANYRRTLVHTSSCLASFRVLLCAEHQRFQKCLRGEPFRHSVVGSFCRILTRVHHDIAWQLLMLFLFRRTEHL